MRLGGVINLRHAHVKGEIAGGFSDRLRHPCFKTRERIVLPRRTAHFDERGGPADQRRLAGGFVRVLRERSHEGQINVDVRVDEAGEDEFPVRVNHLRARRRRDVAVDARDGIAFAPDVGGVAFAGGDDVTVFNQQAHGKFKSQPPGSGKIPSSNFQKRRGTS